MLAALSQLTVLQVGVHLPKLYQVQGTTSIPVKNPLINILFCYHVPDLFKTTHSASSQSQWGTSSLRLAC